MSLGLPRRLTTGALTVRLKLVCVRACHVDCLTVNVNVQWDAGIPLRMPETSSSYPAVGFPVITFHDMGAVPVATKLRIARTHGGRLAARWTCDGRSNTHHVSDGCHERVCGLRSESNRGKMPDDPAAQAHVAANLTFGGMDCSSS